MYQIQRKQHIREELQILDNSGNIANTLAVDIDVDKFQGRWNKACVRLDTAQKQLNEQVSAIAEQEYGEAVITLLQLVFGEKQTDILLNHYEHNYSELLLDVFPFIAEVITPKVNEASATRKKQLMDAAKIVKKNRG